jgi:hypothetical protein
VLLFDLSDFAAAFWLLACLENYLSHNTESLTSSLL